MPDVLRLLVGGRVFIGWKTVRVRRSLVHCAAEFELGVSWEGRLDGSIAPPIVAGDACEVLVDDATVITGYVDQVEGQIDEQVHEVTIAGRDKTADLVDCSAVRKSGQWRGSRIEQIAADLAAPFGVSVRAEVDTGKPLASFALQAGESVFQAVDRAARLRALLLVSNAAGDLVITRAGQERVSSRLELGVNLLALRAASDMRDRFATYTLLGQAPGTDIYSGALVAQIRAEAKDPGVSRYRPLIVTNDSPDVAATLQQRALWEASVRAAKSLTVEAELQGWHHADGLWEPNHLVRVRAPSLSVDDELLITDVEFTKSERGTRTTLALTKPDAFSLLPLKQTGGDGFRWPK